ncbi:MAG: SpoIID/LytB domain-containing protein [Ruminococcus sp.]|nr:SpoIID/LytB domain-containing protein [Ruminococcus sp.]
MKDYLQMIAVTAAALLLIPIVAFAGRKNASRERQILTDGSEARTVTILCTETGEIATLSELEYAVGAVFAQMPADFETEALKAQAVLAYTYAERRRLTEEQSPTEELHGALMSDDTSLYQAYFTPKQAKEVYGDEYDRALNKITEAAESVKGLTLCYDDLPVIAAFHGISFGYTESAFTMWGEDIPYLQSAESLSDTDRDICRSTKTFTDRDIAELISEITEENSPLLTIAEKSEHGTVLTLRAGNAFIGSEEFAEKLSLPSRHFTLSRIREGGAWEIETMGCGHLVGMSQYGADSMAKTGMAFEQILLHYYKDCVLVRK